MIIELADGEEWNLEPAEPGQVSHSIPFASASSRSGKARLSAYLNGELVERVWLSAPHSWWGLSAQYLFLRDPLYPDDEAKIVIDHGDAVIRLDLHETRP